MVESSVLLLEEDEYSDTACYRYNGDDDQNDRPDRESAVIRIDIVHDGEVGQVVGGERDRVRQFVIRAFLRDIVSIVIEVPDTELVPALARLEIICEGDG